MTETKKEKFLVLRTKYETSDDLTFPEKQFYSQTF